MDGKCCSKETMMLLWQKVVVEKCHRLPFYYDGGVAGSLLAGSLLWAMVVREC